MKFLPLFASVLVVMLFAHTAMSADQSLLVANTTGESSRYLQVIEDLNKTPQVLTAQSNIADGGSCSVTCSKGSSSKTCANQGENCSCSCQNDYPDCTACSKE